MAPLLGNFLTIRLQQHSSGVATKVVAETTSVDAQFTAEALESTEQADALVARFEAGKTTINVSGDYLLASDGEQFDNLFAHSNAGDKIEVTLYRAGQQFLDTEGVFTSLNEAGANSDSLATGAYSMELDVVAYEEYGDELHTTANAASDPNGNEADAITGWTSAGLNGTGSNVFESQGAVKNNGSYAFHIDANDTPTSNAAVWVELDAAPFNLSPGDEVKISFNARHIGSGGTWSIGIYTSQVGAPVIGETFNNTETSFRSVEWTFTFASPTHKYFQLIESNAPGDGGVYADNISVKKKL